MARCTLLKCRSSQPSVKHLNRQVRHAGHEDSNTDMSSVKHGKLLKERLRCRNCGVNNKLDSAACKRCQSILVAPAKRPQPPDRTDSDGESDDSEDVSPSASEGWDTDDSTETSGDGSENSGAPSCESRGDKLPRARVRHRKHSRPANFIRVNQRPMMEMKPGSNVWFQARIVKERATEILITFPGVTDDEDDTLEWVPKTSSRIWYGDYKTGSWKYLGKGSWRPKATNKPKAPPMPHASKSAVGKHVAQHTRHELPASSSEKVASVCSEDSAGDTRTRHRKEAMSDTDVAAREVCKRTESHDMSSSRAVHQNSRACHQEIGSKLASSPELGSDVPRHDPLKDWFSAYFRNLDEAALFEDHLAGYVQMDPCRAVERMISHSSATSTNPNEDSSSLGRGAASGHRASGAAVHNAPAFGPGDSVDEEVAVDHRSAKPSGQPHTADTDIRGDSEGEGNARGRERYLPDTFSRSRDHRRAASSEPLKVSSAPSGRAASAEPSGRRLSGKQWQPPKELCHLLDGMFEVRPRVARIQATEQRSDQEQIDGGNWAGTERKLLERGREGSEQRILPSQDPAPQEPGSSRIQQLHNSQARLRGRVLLSDSEDDSDGNAHGRHHHQPLKKSRTHSKEFNQPRPNGSVHRHPLVKKARGGDMDTKHSSPRPERMSASDKTRNFFMEA
mmetsp:Transcript_4614/g.12852  ORF Transcript_4614/g.12852 Transcript_4614/m.12852 type:complete len:676 (-) Transcript_4614:68-2095(-)